MTADAITIPERGKLKWNLPGVARNTLPNGDPGIVHGLSYGGSITNGLEEIYVNNVWGNSESCSGTVPRRGQPSSSEWPCVVFSLNSAPNRCLTFLVGTLIECKGGFAS